MIEIISLEINPVQDDNRQAFDKWNNHTSPVSNLSNTKNKRLNNKHGGINVNHIIRFDAKVGRIGIILLLLN